MDELQREKIANQRFQLIAPLVKSQVSKLPHGERYAILRSIAEGKHPHVPLPTGKVGLRTLERYLQLYEKGSIEALKPKIRERSSSIPKEYLDMACSLRRENMSRSIDRIISMLEDSGRVPEGVLKKSTIYDYFTKQKLTRPSMGKKNGKFTRYGAAYRSEVLQGDTHQTLKLKDPNGSGQYRQVYLFAWIDDYTRLVYGRFYWKERLPALEDSLMKWIILHGVPQSIYCDNGAVYSSHHLENICSSLGIQLHHSRPYKPQGRGKIEKVFQLVESSFKSEVELLIKEGKVTTLTELNNLFSVWLDKFYNKRVHSATKQSPISRWESCSYPINKPPLEVIHEAFMWKEQRSVSLTGIISIDTNDYEVEPFLCGKKVTVKYDPYDLSKHIHVYYDGTQYKDAVPAKIHRHSKKNYSKEVLQPNPPSGLNFLEQLAESELAKKKSMSFSSIYKGGDTL